MPLWNNNRDWLPLLRMNINNILPHQIMCSITWCEHNWLLGEKYWFLRCQNQNWRRTTPFIPKVWNVVPVTSLALALTKALSLILWNRLLRIEGDVLLQISGTSMHVQFALICYLTCYLTSVADWGRYLISYCTNSFVSAIDGVEGGEVYNR